MLSIEVWDTGIGIPDEELQAIFEEYHQLDNAARERSRGLGLGLSIVQRLGNLLGHRVRVRSQPGKGSVFAIEVMLPPSEAAAQLEHHRHGMDGGIVEAAHHRTGAILVVEDDPEVRELLELLLKDEGHHAATAPDGIAALELVARGTIRPDLILADYNLPNGMNGLQLIREAARQASSSDPGHHSDRRHIDRYLARYRAPGLRAAQQAGEVEGADASHPTPPPDIAIRGALARSAAWLKRPTTAESPAIFVVDDDSHIREGLRAVLEDRWPDRRGLCDLRGIPRSLSSRPRSLPLDRCLPAGDERARIAAAAQRCGRSAAGHHDHRQ